MRTTPEQQLVCVLATVTPSPAARAVAVRASSDPAFDWDRALQLAARNWVLPAVSHNLLQHDGALLPDAVHTTIRLARAAARTNGSTIAAHLAPVFARWNSAGLRWALMKGAALIAADYPPDTRFLSDVDVLIAADQYAAARDALLAEGFTPATGTHTEEFMLSAKEQVAFSNAGRAGAAATLVDLHRETYGPSKPYRFDTSELLGRRRAAQFYGAPVYALDAQDLLLHLATQLLNDRLLVKLQRLADLDVLLRQADAHECNRRAEATRSVAGLAMARAAVRAVLESPGDTVTRSDDVDRRATLITRSLLARGWPWASAFEAGALPEDYRRAAAGIVEHGFGGELKSSVMRGLEYRRAARRSGSAIIRSELGGVKMAARGLYNAARVWWEA